MKEKLNNLYVIFPIAGIVFVILNALGLLQRTYGYNTVGAWLEEYDITGLTTIFVIFFTIINVMILIYCCYKGKKGLESGWNYEMNKKLVITFWTLAIIAILCFVGIRSIEESSAQNLNEEVVEIFEGEEYTLSTSTKKKKSNTTSINEILVNEPFY